MTENIKINTRDYEPVVEEWEYVICPYCHKSQEIELQKENFTSDEERKRYHCNFCNRIFEIELKIEKKFYVKPINHKKAIYLFEGERNLLYDLNTPLEPDSTKIPD